MNKNILIFVIMLMNLIPLFTLADIQNASVTVVQGQDYSDVWLGASTGGYKLIAEKGNDFVFRVFVQNGMKDKAIHNLRISPNNIPFEVNSITPKLFEEIQPMEIKLFYVNVTIPAEIKSNTYPVSFDIASDEFPKGVFSLQSEVEIVNKINTTIYIIYAIITLGFIVILFYRKRMIALEVKKHHGKK